MGLEGVLLWSMNKNRSFFPPWFLDHTQQYSGYFWMLGIEHYQSWVSRMQVECSTAVLSL